jgi:hypothetical protein
MPPPNATIKMMMRSRTSISTPSFADGGGTL